MAGAVLAGWSPEVASLPVLVGGVAATPTAFTADWQAEESLATFFCKHCSEARPPVGTPAQYF